MKKTTVDLTQSQNDNWAIFLPSISAIYARIVSMAEYKQRNQLPNAMLGQLNSLDFLSKTSQFFTYKWALYSAGHAVLDPKESDVHESMVQKRNRKNTVLVGDSGGFQAATGVLKFPWFQSKNQSQQEWLSSQDDFRMKILRWLEHTSDWSMILDWPTYGLVKYGFDEKTGVSKHPGLKSFKDCLDGTMVNLDFFVKHRREGATKFLNVLQGRDQKEGDIWYEACKHYPFESWAFSNVQASNFGINLRRLIIMRDEKLLENRDWLHYLGNGKIKAGCSLSTLQKTLRQYVNPNVKISFDAASPFVMTAKGQIYYTYQLDHNDLRFKGGSLPDNKEFKNNQMTLHEWIVEQSTKKAEKSSTGNMFDSLFETKPKLKEFVIPSTMSQKITLGDICCKGHDDVKGKVIGDTIEKLQNELGFINHSNSVDELIKMPSALDGLSYLLVMNHNVELHIKAIQQACWYQDQPIGVAKNHIPNDLLEFKDLCPEIFQSENPMDKIVKHKQMLANITGMFAENHILEQVDNI